MENERKKMLDRMGEIQRVLSSLGYEVVGFEISHEGSLVVKLDWFTAPSLSSAPSESSPL